jgi:hypothetical protein
MDIWLLTDCRRSHGGELPPRIHFADEAELQRTLRGWVEPNRGGVVNLHHGNISAMRCGIHSSCGFVQFLQHGSGQHGCMAAAKPILAPDLIEFFDQGVTEPIWPENLLPLEQVIRLAVDFYRTGRCPISVKWEKRTWKDEW